MTDITSAVLTRGDLAHLALFLWATGASSLLVWCLKEMASANARFDSFVREISTLNKHFGRGE